MASQARQQPPWKPPHPINDTHTLTIWNSLTKSKTHFVPLDPHGKAVTWYACGPTVYDDAHIGHARNYVSTDIIRRIMTDYFKFDVKFVMNITDVDDKIIVRARQNYLLDEFNDPDQRRGSAGVLETTVAAFNAYVHKHLDLIPRELDVDDIGNEIQKRYKSVLDGKPLGEDAQAERNAKTRMHVKTALAASTAITSMKTNPTEQPTDDVQDVLLPYLDSLYGSTIDAQDHTIFTRLTQKFETRFTEDMQALNVMAPDAVTRVTEYVPQIIAFVAQIEDKGFAYKTSDGSVYFDIEAFEAANNYYARLEPRSRNNTDLQADGEGALTKKSSEKKSDADFALWKSSKPGEPSWPSPWGPGRPGWHIECSAMASHVLGTQMDIHSGGIDLAFPHHDNELAQSEAYHCDRHHGGEHQWVNYFMHMGHLSSAGAKMSKSLKNFKTIRHELSREDGWTSRSLRIIFLLGGWKDGIEITDDLKKEGSGWEDKVNNFFIKALNIIDNHDDVQQHTNLNPTIEQALEDAQLIVLGALSDSFNTPLAMRAMSELITKYNLVGRNQVGFEQMLKVARWLTRMVNVFGLNGSAKPDDAAIGWSGIDVPAYAKPYLKEISRIRDKLRQQAQMTSTAVQMPDVTNVVRTFKKGSLEPSDQSFPYQVALDRVLDLLSKHKDDKHTRESVMAIADQIRDNELWNLGIYLEDQPDSSIALIRPVTKELREARTSKKAKAKKSDGDAATKETALPTRIDERHISPKLMFRTGDHIKEFSEWDEKTGLPTKDKSGNEITKTKRKKLEKLQERRKELHGKWQAQQQGDQAT
ncbi:MAG: hypothetical protein Q9166_005959 [cf. Caloplaca sp. 2 TL-2023]